MYNHEGFIEVSVAELPRLLNLRPEFEVTAVEVSDFGRTLRLKINGATLALHYASDPLPSVDITTVRYG